MVSAASTAAFVTLNTVAKYEVVSSSTSKNLSSRKKMIAQQGTRLCLNMLSVEIDSCTDTSGL